MAEIIRMPRMSDTMEEGVIIAWHKNPGDMIEAGDLLAEIETDKATMDFESPIDGILLHIEVNKGPVAIDEIIAVIGEKGEDFNSELNSARNEGFQHAIGAEEKVISKNIPETDLKSSPIEASSGRDQKIKASPLAKKMAKEAGINLFNVSGSGDNDRIVKRDIEAFMTLSKPVPDQSLSISSDNPEEFELFPLSQMRKTIARRLTESKFSAPHFYLRVEIDMENTIKTRTDINEGGDIRISYNDFVIKAAAMALRKHPAINASWLSDKIRYNKHINIGVAVAVEDGLFVPVVMNADNKSFSQINSEVKELVIRAKSKNIQPEEMGGNTFTISNLGMFGITEFTAIINPPDACILAIGSIIQKPVIRQDQIVVGSTMKVTMSCDHRVVDGATAAMFLQSFRKNLEQPANMLV